MLDWESWREMDSVVHLIIKHLVTQELKEFAFYIYNVPNMQNESMQMLCIQSAIVMVSKLKVTKNHFLIIRKTLRMNLMEFSHISYKIRRNNISIRHDPTRFARRILLRSKHRSIISGLR